jgi:DNA-directed RNA polymerases I, II, and III subunit RPABC3
MEYLFDDVFLVKEIDNDGKKFDKGLYTLGIYLLGIGTYILCLVSRMEGRSEHYDMALLLDYASDIYCMRVGERYHLVLSASLTSVNAVGGMEGGVAAGSGSLADRFDYVMHGIIYKAEEAQKSSPSHGESPLSSTFCNIS